MTNAHAVLFYGNRYSNVSFVIDGSNLNTQVLSARKVWLTSAFAPFEESPGATVTPLGSFDMEIGPHIFIGTLFYEVTYQKRDERPTPTDPDNGAYLQSPTASHQPSREPSHPSAPSSSTAPPPASSNSHLISQIDTAAGSDPELRRLLKVAAEGKATPKEMETLVHKIASISSPLYAGDAAEPSSSGTALAFAPPSSAAALATHGKQTVNIAKSNIPATPFTSKDAAKSFVDVIFGFSESHDDAPPSAPPPRFVLPLANSVVERVFETHSAPDPAKEQPSDIFIIKISTVFPQGSVDARFASLLQAAEGGPAANTDIACHPVTLVITNASCSLWEAIDRKVEHKNKARLDRIAKVLQDMARIQI